MISNFLFHRVSPERDQLWDPMDPFLFEKCIVYIKEKFEIVLFEEYIFSSDLKKQSKKPKASIMFDDGYKDNIVYALPILEKHGVKASFYVVTDCITNNMPTWTYVLDYQLFNTQIRELKMDLDFLPENLKVVNIDSLNKRIALAKELKPLIKKLPMVQKDKILILLNHRFREIEIPKIMMNWDDLRFLDLKGHYVGSHTLSHPMLGFIDDRDVLKKELEDSKKAIQKELNKDPLTISYPIGSYNKETIKMAKEAGYKIGLAVKQQKYDPKNTSLFEVPRIELYNESWFKTKLRINNLLEKIKSILIYR